MLILTLFSALQLTRRVAFQQVLADKCFVLVNDREKLVFWFLYRWLPPTLPWTVGGLQRELLLLLQGEERLVFQPGILPGTGSSSPGDQRYQRNGNSFLILWGSSISLQIPLWLTSKQCCHSGNILTLKERKDLWLRCFSALPVSVHIL